MTKELCALFTPSKLHGAYLVPLQVACAENSRVLCGRVGSWWSCAPIALKANQEIRYTHLQSIILNLKAVTSSFDEPAFCVSVPAPGLKERCHCMAESLLHQLRVVDASMQIDHVELQRATKRLLQTACMPCLSIYSYIAGYQGL